MPEPIQLQQQDLHYLRDTDFLAAKLRIQEALRRLLEQTQQQIGSRQAQFRFPDAVWQVPPKISRGENYKGLPYLVLDYPRIFQQHTTFAYRCMFWWGWGFSCTLHLGGHYWQEYQQQIIKGLPHLSANSWWVGVGESPWEYHYQPSNYLSLAECLRENRLQELLQKPFFKISCRLPLEHYQQLPAFSLQALEQLSALWPSPVA